jgi:thiamine kinase-like enzyme
MSNVTNSLSDRSFLFRKNNEPTNGQIELVKLILEKHGETEYNSIKFIDENDNYDSFYIETITGLGLCLKISFDPIPINYDILILSGIQDQNIAPIPIHKGSIDLQKTVYYTIQSFEYSDSVKSLGGSILLDEQYKDFYTKLLKLHRTPIPQHIPQHLDDVKTYLEYHKFNFKDVSQYIEESEVADYTTSHCIYDKVFKEMMEYVNQNFYKINDNFLIHGNLDASTIICSHFDFKFINFENSFLGSIYFDIASLAFELNVSGINEYNLVTEYAEKFFVQTIKYELEDQIEKYKICKKIWTYKLFLDLIKDYFKEVLILNAKRKDKVIFLASEFSKHFYKFDSNLVIFKDYKDFFIQKLTYLLDNV